MRPLLLVALASAAEAARYVMYFDQYHTAKLPDRSKTGSVTHVITAFALSDLFNSGGEYVPFMPLASVRAMFPSTTKVCMAIGGWGDTEGFSAGSKTDASRKTFAKNVAATVKRLGYDCVDIDWEYPGGNGENYKEITNDKKTFEIDTYPLLLAEIKKAIGNMELSIAVPGLKRDLIAYTRDTVPKIEKVVDFVNVMSYDLMNRRDNETTHHTSLGGSREIIKLYMDYGFSAAKINMGFAFYAKWYTTKPGVVCDKPRGCAVVPLEGSDGKDLSTSGATTFEAVNWEPVPKQLSESPDGSCGPGTGFKCGDNNCCGQYNFCGDSAAHCGAGCWHGYGLCKGPSIVDSFRKAMVNGQYQASFGAQWYWDPETSLYWSWDTTQIVDRKIGEVVKGLNLGGIMAWSLAEDSYKWEHLDAMTAGFKKYLV